MLSPSTGIALVEATSIRTTETINPEQYLVVLAMMFDLMFSVVVIKVFCVVNSFSVFLFWIL